MYSKTQLALNSLRTNDLKTLAREFKFSTSGTREALINRLLLKGGGKSEDSNNSDKPIVNSKFVQNLMIDVPNFAQNASFLTLLKLSQTNKEMREKLLPILKAKRAQELETMRIWFKTLHRNHTLDELINKDYFWLDSKQITIIPPEIGQLNNLKTLYLSNNQITEIPPEIGLLTNLKVLNLHGNQITVIPPEIGLLTNLEYLDLGSNKITEISPTIGQLTNLVELNLDYNEIMEIPSEIGQLTNLKELHLSENNIKVIPPEIGQLTNLEKLRLQGNQMEQIPPEIGHLTQQHGGNLRELFLYNNPITEIPPNLRRPGLEIRI